MTHVFYYTFTVLHSAVKLYEHKNYYKFGYIANKQKIVAEVFNVSNTMSCCLVNEKQISNGNLLFFEVSLNLVIKSILHVHK